jgi:hypothetical protein
MVVGMGSLIVISEASKALSGEVVDCNLQLSQRMKTNDPTRRPEVTFCRFTGKTTENQRVGYRWPMWKASEIDVEGIRNQCGRLARPMWTAPGNDVDSTGGDVPGPESDVDGARDRCGQRLG